MFFLFGFLKLGVTHCLWCFFNLVNLIQIHHCLLRYFHVLWTIDQVPLHFEASLSKILSLALFFFFCFFRETGATYGSSQARSQIGAAAATLHHSHSKARSESPMRPTPQLPATPDPQPTGQGQESNPHPLVLVGLISAEPQWELLRICLMKKKKKKKK